jgi:hypothetical protein
MRTMYAVVRDNTLDSEKLVRDGGNIAEFHAAHAAQAGYLGSVIVDAGSGRQITLTLWRSAEEAEAARIALGPVIQRVLVPLMAAPSALVGVGEVIFNDLSTSDQTRAS